MLNRYKISIEPCGVLNDKLRYFIMKKFLWFDWEYVYAFSDKQYKLEQKIVYISKRIYPNRIHFDNINDAELCLKNIRSFSFKWKQRKMIKNLKRKSNEVYHWL